MHLRASQMSLNAALPVASRDAVTAMADLVANHNAKCIQWSARNVARTQQFRFGPVATVRSTAAIASISNAHLAEQAGREGCQEREGAIATPPLSIRIGS